MEQEFFANPPAGFEEAVRIVLNNWTVLRLAVENGWGGDHASCADKLGRLLSNITVFFGTTAGCVNDLDVADSLEEVLSEEFMAVADDGSAREVAKILVEIHSALFRGVKQDAEAARAVLVKHVERIARPLPGLEYALKYPALATPTTGERKRELEAAPVSDQEAAECEAEESAAMDEEGAGAPPVEPVSSGPVIDDEGFQYVTRSRRGRGRGRGRVLS